jgi:hypothetical protein
MPFQDRVCQWQVVIIYTQNFPREDASHTQKLKELTPTSGRSKGSRRTPRYEDESYRKGSERAKNMSHGEQP